MKQTIEQKLLDYLFFGGWISKAMIEAWADNNGCLGVTAVRQMQKLHAKRPELFKTKIERKMLWYKMC